MLNLPTPAKNLAGAGYAKKWPGAGAELESDAPPTYTKLIEIVINTVMLIIIKKVDYS